MSREKNNKRQQICFSFYGTIKWSTSQSNVLRTY